MASSFGYTFQVKTHARFRHASLGCLLSCAVFVGLAASCQKEEPEGGLESGGAGSGGRAGSPSIITGGTGGTLGGGSGGSGGNAGAPEMPPEGQACEELSGLEQCGGSSVEAKLNTIQLLLVIDKSGSMTDRPEGFDTDKWSAMKEALETVLGDVNDRVHVGLALYPYSFGEPIPEVGCTDNCCEVPTGALSVLVHVAPSVESGPAILAELEATSPGGGTPTAKALAGAYEYFTTGAGASLEGDRYVLLATDGGPNCNAELECDADACTPNLDGQCPEGNCCEDAGLYCVDESGVSESIQALAEAGIPTFVVGIPGTDDYADYLDAFAVAGGVPNTDGSRDYFAVSASAGVRGLVDVFTDITTDLVTSCEIPLETSPQVLDEVNVAIDCEVVKKEGEDGAGWDYDTTPNPGYVVLKGKTCEDLQASGASRIDVVFGCPTIR
jgi:hypothetical protein